MSSPFILPITITSWLLGLNETKTLSPLVYSIILELGMSCSTVALNFGEFFGSTSNSKPSRYELFTVVPVLYVLIILAGASIPFINSFFFDCFEKTIGINKKKNTRGNKITIANKAYCAIRGNSLKLYDPSGMSHIATKSKTNGIHIRVKHIQPIFRNVLAVNFIWLKLLISGS